MRYRLLPAVVLLLAPVALRAQDRPGLPPTEAKASFLKLLDRPKVPADAKPTESGGPVGPTWETLSIASEKKADGTVERVPLLVVKPAGAGRKPCVIVLHGTGGNKEGTGPWLDEFAGKGFVAVAIDARYHGARVPGVKGAAAYVDAITRAWRAKPPHDHPFYYDTVWDLWRVVDYLQTRDDVDPARIGMVGISMGGIQTWLAASVDDRVKVACPLIAVQSLKWSLDNEKWQGRAKTIWAAHEAAAKDLGEPAVNARVCRELWGKVVPGITSDFDCPNLLPLFAGRALFVANGELDPNCPIDGAKVAIRSAQAAFAKAGASDKLVVRINPGVAHKVTDEDRAACVAFCEKWLTK